MTKELPANPNLEYLKKEAKRTLRSHKNGDVSCCRTLQHLHQFKGKSDEEVLKSKVTLADVQFAIALV